jgi:predicted ABC-type exoprotein transport system permease subunit
MAYVYTELDVSPRRHKELFLAVGCFSVAFISAADFMVLVLQGVLTKPGIVLIGSVAVVSLLVARFYLAKFEIAPNDYNRLAFTDMSIEAELRRTDPVGVFLRLTMTFSSLALFVMGAVAATDDTSVNSAIMLIGVFGLNALTEVYTESADPPPPSSCRRLKSGVTKLRHA